MPNRRTTHSVKLVRKIILQRIRSKSFQTVGLYTLGSVCSRGISFIFLPVFTYFISAAGFGILALISNSILLLNGLILFSTNVTLNAEFFKEDKQAYRKLFTSLFGYVAGSTLLAMLLIAIFYRPLHDNFGFQPYYILLLPFLTFLNFFYEQLNNFLRLREEPVRFFILNVSRAAVEVLTAIALLYFFRLDYVARIISMTLAPLVFAGYAAWYFFVRMKLWGKFDWKVIRHEIPFGISILINTLGIFLMGSADKFFIKYISGDNSITGIYNIAFTLSSVVFIFSSAMVGYITPNLYRHFTNGNGDNFREVKRLLSRYILAMAGAGLLVFMVGFVAYHYLMNPTYLAGFNAFCLLLVGNLFWACCTFLYPVLWYYRAKRILVYTSVGSMVLSFVTYYFLIRYYLMEGAAVASIIIYAVTGATLFLIVHRLLEKKSPVAVTPVVK
ncbi:MAG: hypothetical protein EOO05_12935 [Chitinophagaceae bacterium]|nr:MAG: hypothetical protein EOO05_12935 [Chitinophagaceae bacterium]